MRNITTSRKIQISSYYDWIQALPRLKNNLISEISDPRFFNIPVVYGLKVLTIAVAACLPNIFVTKAIKMTNF